MTVLLMDQLLQFSELIQEFDYSVKKIADRGQHVIMGSEWLWGEFVTFIDADDYYCPRKLEEEMTLCGRNKGQNG